MDGYPVQRQAQCPAAVRHGVSTNSTTNFEAADAGGKHVSVVGWGEPFYSVGYCRGYCAFQTADYKYIRSRGAIPFVSWSSAEVEPSGRNVLRASKLTDAAVASGSQDAYITRWAKAAKAWGHPLFLRFDWEMNGAWFSWGTSRSGRPNSARSFVAMWKHVYRLFHQQGASNVTFVWCPNIDTNHSFAPLSRLYPAGDRRSRTYVNWTCMDAYNPGGSSWTSFANLISPARPKMSTYNAILHLARSKPMMLGEVGSSEHGGSKARWITDMFNALSSRFRRIRAVLWFEKFQGGPRDWPIESSTSSRLAFRRAISRRAYQGSRSRT